jgi:hypothetical protein
MVFLFPYKDHFYNLLSIYTFLSLQKFFHDRMPGMMFSYFVVNAAAIGILVASGEALESKLLS